MHTLDTLGTILKKIISSPTCSSTLSVASVLSVTLDVHRGTMRPPPRTDAKAICRDRMPHCPIGLGAVAGWGPVIDKINATDYHTNPPPRTAYEANKADVLCNKQPR